MLPFVCLVTTILVSALSVQGSGVHHIVGGTEARSCEFPHIVFIYTTKNGKHFGCGGSIIDDKHIITAAHCMAGDVTRVFILIGSLDQTTMPVWMPVTTYAKHHRYRSLRATELDDVAVLKVISPIAFTPCIKPIRMAVPGEGFVGDCTIAGWGSTGFNLPGSHKLLRADIPLMDKKKCEQILPVILDQHICGGSGKNNDKTTCSGDSGGPLMCTSAVDGVRVLAGLVSYGWKCDTGLAVFTKVSYFLPWINAVVKQMS